ncbi:type II secretion system protein [Dechloromonas sp. HYN0024]|uniref:type II secretion system protein n=1 Tax=Dechloromonas sp. HYN0024 TaxID=2231055 RepID=UPI000E432245|nr:type II secretion system protein [Dechloromonas sp. HYN0024]AXS80138.1 type II secretion system protein [Dechloromonas sp. HYN0024]
MKGRQGGFSYLFTLFMVALGGIMLVASTQTAWMESKRDKEAELLFAGNEIRNAIEAYAKATPPLQANPGATGTVGGGGQYPIQLEDLLADHRHTPPLRHLRRIYIDPMTGSKEWELIQEGGRIIGVYSRSLEKPLKTAKFGKGYESFAKANSYADWKFSPIQQDTAKPAAAINGPVGNPSAAGPTPAVSPADESPSSQQSSPLSPIVEFPPDPTPVTPDKPAQQTADGQQSNAYRVLQCVIAYGNAMRECRRASGNSACMAGAQASRDACLAGG